jgi:hypothetical protein
MLHNLTTKTLCTIVGGNNIYNNNISVDVVYFLFNTWQERVYKYMQLFVVQTFMEL